MTVEDARGLCCVLEQLGYECCVILRDLFNEAMPEFIWIVTGEEDTSWSFWADPRTKQTVH